MTNSDNHTLYATIALTFRIDDAEALANAAQMLPYEENMRFDRASLDQMTPEMLRAPGAALGAAVSPLITQVFSGLHELVVPGATLVRLGHLQLGYDSPRG